MYLTATCIKTMTRGPFTKTINLTEKIRKTREQCASDALYVGRGGAHTRFMDASDICAFT